MTDINKIISNMSIEEMVEQLLDYDIQPKDTPNETKDVLSRIHAGGLYFGDYDNANNFDELKKLADLHKEYKEIASADSGIPVVGTADIEHGAGEYCPVLAALPYPMTWGAANDEELVERAGEFTAMISRKLGISHALAPVVDLSLDFRNPIVNIRAISDDPDRVIKIAGAYIRGLQKNGYVAATLKHFPGDGADDRNQHFLTTTNNLSKEEWLNTYGKIYKELFKQGVASVMVAHIACPAFQSAENQNDALPATLSKELLTDLLKNELGFDGCVISDAMSMVGVCARAKHDRLAVEFIKAGGDLLLFPEPTDGENILAAVKSGEITKERLKDAVTRVLKMKEKARLFEENKVQEELSSYTIEQLNEEVKKVSLKIAEKGIKIVRNRKNVLPIKEKKTGKALVICLAEPHFNKPPTGEELIVLKREIEKRGYQCDYLSNPKHTEIKKVMNDYDFIVVGSHISSLNCCNMRMSWTTMMTFWRGYIFDHPNLIFVSFGDPYKLYDFPNLDTYVNAFGDTDEAEIAAAELIFGEITNSGKNPITFKNFFEREE